MIIVTGTLYGDIKGVLDPQCHPCHSYKQIEDISYQLLVNSANISQDLKNLRVYRESDYYVLL